MNDQELAHEIANSVVRDTQFWIAVVGILGVVVGSLATIAGNVLLNWLKGRKQKSLDKARKELLRQMLTAKDWRNLSTLSRVIGADGDETKRLLIATDARGSELPKDNNEEAWGLISKHPLSEIE
jgi:hypothetical protein